MKKELEMGIRKKISKKIAERYQRARKKEKGCHQAGYNAPPIGTYSAPPIGTHSAPPIGTYSAPPVSTHSAPPVSTYSAPGLIGKKDCKKCLNM